MSLEKSRESGSGIFCVQLPKVSALLRRPNWRSRVSSRARTLRLLKQLWQPICRKLLLRHRRLSQVQPKLYRRQQSSAIISLRLARGLRAPGFFYAAESAKREARRAQGTGCQTLFVKQPSFDQSPLKPGQNITKTVLKPAPSAIVKGTVAMPRRQRRRPADARVSDRRRGAALGEAATANRHGHRDAR